MFVYHAVDPNLRVEIFFKKEGAAENGSVDFEKGDIGTSAHLYWKLKKISCWAVPEVLNMKYRSELKHGFTNHGFLHCAILKGLHGFKEKEPTSQGICNFSFKMFKVRSSRFWKCLKTTLNSSEQPAELTQK